MNGHMFLPAVDKIGKGQRLRTLGASEVLLVKNLSGARPQQPLRSEVEGTWGVSCTLLERWRNSTVLCQT